MAKTRWEAKGRGRRKAKPRFTIESDDPESITVTVEDIRTKKKGAKRKTYLGTHIAVTDVDEENMTTTTDLYSPRRLDDIKVIDTNTPGITMIEARARDKQFRLMTGLSGVEIRPLVKKASKKKNNGKKKAKKKGKK